MAPLCYTCGAAYSICSAPRLATHGPACGPASSSIAGGTRTCIHTPGEPLDPAELALPCSRIRTVLDGAALVYFDGRLAEAALLLAGIGI